MKSARFITLWQDLGAGCLGLCIVLAGALGLSAFVMYFFDILQWVFS